VWGRVGQVNAAMEPPKAVTMAVTITMRGWLLMKGKAQILKRVLSIQRLILHFIFRDFVL
jgi:hypothetical protein